MRRFWLSVLVLLAWVLAMRLYVNLPEDVVR